MSQTIGQNITELTILEQSIEGFQGVLGKLAAGYGKKPLNVIFSPNEWSQRELFLEKGTIEYPYLALNLTRIARNADSYNENLWRVGVPITKPGTNKIALYRLRPVICNFRVRYFCQSNQDMLTMVRRWLMRQKDMQYALRTDNFQIKIRIKLNDDLSIPEQEMQTTGNILTLETDCEMQTYVGEIELKHKLTELVLTTNLWSEVSKTVLESRKQIIPITEKDTEFTAG